jgi:hypothetical protein
MIFDRLFFVHDVNLFESIQIVRRRRRFETSDDQTVILDRVSICIVSPREMLTEIDPDIPLALSRHFPITAHHPASKILCRALRRVY